MRRQAATAEAASGSKPGTTTSDPPATSSRPHAGPGAVMAKRQYSNVRGVAKAERERERQAKKEEKLANRRKARDQPLESKTRAGKGQEPRTDNERHQPGSSHLPRRRADRARFRGLQP